MIKYIFPYQINLVYCIMEQIYNFNKEYLNNSDIFIIQKSDVRKHKHVEFILYFLINNNEVVYIGITNNIIQRLWNHKNKKYTHICIIYCKDYNNQHNAEKISLEIFKPILNSKKYNNIFHSGYNVSVTTPISNFIL